MEKHEVERFLTDFRTKKGIWGIRFYNERNKNTQALLFLEITPAQREKIIDALVALDYVEGPIEDAMYRKSDMWVFGRIVSDIEIYIKITMGDINSQTICISFHPAEHALGYPLR